MLMPPSQARISRLWVFRSYHIICSTLGLSDGRFTDSLILKISFFDEISCIILTVSFMVCRLSTSMWHTISLSYIASDIICTTITAFTLIFLELITVIVISSRLVVHLMISCGVVPSSITTSSRGMLPLMHAHRLPVLYSNA